MTCAVFSRVADGVERAGDAGRLQVAHAEEHAATAKPSAM